MRIGVEVFLLPLQKDDTSRSTTWSDLILKSQWGVQTQNRDPVDRGGTGERETKNLTQVLHHLVSYLKAQEPWDFELRAVVVILSTISKS